MTLYLIGLGLNTVKDLSVRSVEILRKCDEVILEYYTSLYRSTPKEIEALIGRPITVGDRAFVEGKLDDFVSSAKEKEIALLVIGDPLMATTHISYVHEAKQQGIAVEIIHNASVMNAVAQTGLELYKFGRVISIPFATREVTGPIDYFHTNYKADLHTLFLLDLHTKEDRFMSTQEAIAYLLGHGVDEQLLAVACGALATSDQKIVSGTLRDLKSVDLGVYPQCLIIPAKTTHFVEEEMIKTFSLS